MGRFDHVHTGNYPLVVATSINSKDHIAATDFCLLNFGYDIRQKNVIIQALETSWYELECMSFNSQPVPA